MVLGVCLDFGCHLSWALPTRRMSIVARRFPPDFKRDVVTVARRSDATDEEFASDFGISVNSPAPMDEAGADGLTAGPVGWWSG